MEFTEIPGVDEGRLDDELILLHPGTLHVKVLNETAAVPWDALGEFPTVDQLAGLLAEARPEISREEGHAHVTTFVEELAAAGFIERQDRA